MAAREIPDLKVVCSNQALLTILLNFWPPCRLYLWLSLLPFSSSFRPATRVPIELPIATAVTLNDVVRAGKADTAIRTLFFGVGRLD